jgi:hypothetical protein
MHLSQWVLIDRDNFFVLQKRAHLRRHGAEVVAHNQWGLPTNAAHHHQDKKRQYYVAVQPTETNAISAPSRWRGVAANSGRTIDRQSRRKVGRRERKPK